MVNSEICHNFIHQNLRLLNLNFNVSISGGKIEAVTRASGSSVYTVKCVYHTHGTNQSLKKVTAQIECMLMIF